MLLDVLPRDDRLYPFEDCNVPLWNRVHTKTGCMKTGWWVVQQENVFAFGHDRVGKDAIKSMVSDFPGDV